MTPTRVLITGIRGFTGRFVAAALAATGHEVFGTATDQEPGAVARPASQTPPSEVHVPLPAEAFTTLDADLLDRERLKAVVTEIRPHYVIHLAAVTHVMHGDVDQTYRTNVVGSRNLLAALTACTPLPRRVILASSANVYGNADVDVLAEDAPINPANDYGVSKAAMELMARLWAPRVPLLIVRPFNYTGVGQSDAFVVPKIVNHFRRGERSIALGNIDVARDLSDVRDVALIYQRLLMAKPDHALVNICCGAATSVRDIIATLEAIAGYGIHVEVDTALVRPNEIRILRGSTARLQAMVGPVERHAVSETLRWMYEG